VASTHTLDVPGAHLHYEVRGRGPLLFVIGSPMAAAMFAPLADAMADERTVVTVDPRGIAASTLDDPEQDTNPDLRADDTVAILDALGAERADVFGSSGGALTGLAMVVRHPGRVGTLVAHEPPLLELLPDADAQRAATDDIVEAFHRDGPGAAWFKFMVNAGFDLSAEGAPAAPPEESSEQALADSARFFAHDLRPSTRWLPDLDALAAGASRVVVGIGVGSGALITHRTSVALAGRLGVEPVVFPGDHGGFLDDVPGFADVLRKALVGAG
jgi:pimeloyl-ACP methyl ester carboxylesterase